MPANLLPLDECAERLRIAYNERAKHNLTLWREGQDVAARQRALTPAEGWPGKNTEARDAARDAAFAADETLAAHITNRDGAQAKLIELAGEIEGYEADRRGGEWSIRSRLVEALTHGGIAQQSRGDRMEAAHDDVTQAAADRALEDVFALDQAEQAAALGGAAELATDGVDIPF